MKRSREAVARMAAGFPPKAPRERGGRKKAISFKASEPLASYVETALKNGWSLTEVMMTAGVLAMDVLSGIAAVRFLVEHEAARRGLSLGKAAAALCVERLAELYPEVLRDKSHKR